MTFLIIVESPSKCKSIEKYAGKNYKCVASYGHINTLSKLQNIDIENGYATTYTLLPSKKKQLNEIGRLIKECGKDNVILATDPDREGEAIAWHLCNYFGLDPNTPRIIFNEITQNAVQKAISTPTRLDMNKIKSQQARQTVDLLVGFKTCPLLWKHMGIGDASSPISAGRCQTPCLKLVVDHDIREKEKKQSIDFTLKFHYETFFQSPLIFSLNISSSLEHLEINEVNTKELLEVLAKKSSYTLFRSGVKTKVVTSPYPLTTSSLQQKANNLLGLTPSKTMSIAQQLYEKGYITYMRTDSQRYSNDFITSVIHYLKISHYGNYIKETIHSLKNNTQKVNSQDGHESIRPTVIIVSPETLSSKGMKPQEIKLYKLIYEHTLQTFLKDAKYNYIDIELTATNSTHATIKTVSLNATVNKMVYIGWKAIRSVDGDEETRTNEKVFEFIEKKYVKINEPLSFNDLPENITIEPSLKGMPSYYSEASIVKLLEKKQIGRPATYASLVNKIQTRHFVEKMSINPKIQESCIYSYSTKLLHNNFNIEKKELKTSLQKNKIVLNDLGRRIHDFCYEFFEPLFNYDFTASLESKLDNIGSGEDSYENVCKECDIVLNECIDKLSFGKKNSTLLEPDKAVVKMKIEAIKNRNREELILGEYNDYPLIIKSGIYGYYASLGTEKISLKKMNIIDKDDFVYEDVVCFIEKQRKKEGVLRELDDKISILKGKNGKSDYICIKKPSTKYKKSPKPIFISLKKFENDYLTCDEEKLREFITIHKKD